MEHNVELSPAPVELTRVIWFKTWLKKSSSKQYWFLKNENEEDLFSWKKEWYEDSIMTLTLTRAPRVLCQNWLTEVLFVWTASAFQTCDLTQFSGAQKWFPLYKNGADARRESCKWNTMWNCPIFQRNNDTPWCFFHKQLAIFAAFCALVVSISLVVFMEMREGLAAAKNFARVSMETANEIETAKSAHCKYLMK